MNSHEQRISRKWIFSLRHLLMLTALTALAIAIILASRENERLTQSRTEMLTVSRRLNTHDEDELAHVKLHRFAGDFESWEVNIPQGPALELRLGIGQVSESGIPSQVDRVPLTAGRHRVTLHDVTTADRGKRFVVYVDGEQVIDKKPPPEWLSGGWRHSTGLSWPRKLTTNKQTTLQLTGKIYTPKSDIGKGNYFNGSVDNFVTNAGFRLWIDTPDRTYAPASPFLGFDIYTGYGIGLRDGLRYKKTNTASYELAFTRPKSQDRDPVLSIIPEFIADGQSVLSAQTASFSSWQLRNDPLGKDTFEWMGIPPQTAYSAFLCADLTTDDGVKPVIELKWDADKPSDMGLRLARTPANARITHLRLRIVGGTEHLWRIIDTGARELNSRKEIDEEKTGSCGIIIPLEETAETEADVQINWRTDQSLPLQVVERSRVKPNPYSGLTLYDGLPLKFAARIPRILEPSIFATRINEHPTIPDTPFPDGAVFEEIQIELKCETDDWIWLQAEDYSSRDE